MTPKAMTVDQRIDAIRTGMVKFGLVKPGQPLDVLTVYCNGCGFMGIAQRRDDEEEEHFIGRFKRVALDWELGDIFEETDFCPSCVAGRRA